MKTITLSELPALLRERNERGEWRISLPDSGPALLDGETFYVALDRASVRDLLSIKE